METRKPKARQVREKLCGILLTLLFFAPLTAGAQNPIIRDQFTADPTARVFDGKVYLYPSHDILSPEEQERKNWFTMADYHVFSSADLVNWTDHGIILSQERVPWGNPKAYSMWAPDCVCKDGKYYFYFPDAPKSGRGFAVGVAVADRPEGPFTCEPEPMPGVTGIDPCVLLDDDGSAYIYWSGMGLRGARLKENMKELATESQAMEGLPEGFKEGPFAFKRDGWYYLTFPWVRKQQGGTETLAYAMSRSPLGPWDFKGIIMAEHANRCWTNHHSLVQYQGQWYLFYHHNDFSPRDDKRRSARIERLAFNPDGTIQEVRPTLRGVGISKATERIDVDRYSEAGDVVTVSYVDSLNPFQGWSVMLPRKGSWLRYTDVDFSAVKDGYLVVCVRAHANTELLVRERSPKGKVMARMPVTVVNERGPFRRDMSGQWLTLTAPLVFVPQGTADLVLTCEGEGVEVDWLQFKNRPEYFVSASGAEARPDERGFIRRWMLLEPIRQDVRSNVVFTNTWLREAFGKTYFKDQMTIRPKDGQRVKVGQQTLRWHSLDSRNYNVKLFRFAERWGEQTYGSLFWGVALVDSPEELTDVRLAAGSNGASMWWLNGEEVLLLEGDRRMVEDDGMSGRLTLRQGQNVLRFALINGPGLSDCCVRFLDEKGNPITNLTIR